MPRPFNPSFAGRQPAPKRRRALAVKLCRAALEGAHDPLHGLIEDHPDDALQDGILELEIHEEPHRASMLAILVSVLCLWRVVGVVAMRSRCFRERGSNWPLVVGR